MRRDQQRVLLALGWYDYRLHRGIEKFAREHGWYLSANLTRENVIDVAAIDSLVELNIGHALIADAVFLGLSAAVKAFREAIDKGLALRKS